MISTLLVIHILVTTFCLHADPSGHPELGDLFSLIYKSHIKQQLRCPPHSTFQGTPDPSMSEGCVLTDEDSMLLGLEVSRKIQSLLERSWGLYTRQFRGSNAHF